MIRNRKLPLPVGVVALAALAMAATAALAYERTSDAAAIVAMTTTDPGVDPMITGPVGPGKMSTRPGLNASRDGDDRPVRRRMRSN